MLGLDQDRSDLQAQLEDMARALGEALAHSRRVHHVESQTERLREDLQLRSAEQSARDAAMREAIAEQGQAQAHHTQTLQAALAEQGQTQANHTQALQATLAAQAQTQANHTQTLQAALAAQAQTQAHHTQTLQAALAAQAQAQSARDAILLELLRALHAELQQTRADLAGVHATAAAERLQLETAIAQQAQTTHALLRALEQAQTLAAEAQAEGRQQSLQLLTHTAHEVGSMQTQLIRSPLYLQPGLTAVTRLGGADGHPLAVPTSHAGVLFSHYANGADSGEPGLRALIRAKVQAGQTAVDIGAHVGVHAVILGFQVGESGRLFCFEPDPDLAAALHVTLLMNGMLQRGQVIAAAVAETPGRMAFHRTPHSPESTLFPDPGLLHRDSIEVDVTSLDTALPAGQPVHFVKIDAEGAEARIYRGMARILRENRSIRLAVEFAPSHFARAGEDPAAFLAHVQADGFSLFAITEPDGTAVPIKPAALLAARTTNILLERG